MTTIAIIGASTDRNKFGNKAVRAYQQKGYQVFPIHPKEKEIEGIPAFPNIEAIPVAKVDRVSMYVPPAVGLQLLEGIAKKHPEEVWFNPGSESPEIAAKGEKLGLNIIEACSIVAIGVRPSDL